MAGMEASTITSEGTCRLVMPRVESTIARAGPAARAVSISARISLPSGSFSRPARIAPRPSSGDRPAAARASPWRSRTGPMKAFTTWPKMIGSDTFIMVAFRCTENNRPSCLAASTCSAKKSSKAVARMTVASTTSPGNTSRPSRRTVTVPSPSTWRMVSTSPPASTTDCSLWWKSPEAMVATRVRESGSQTPIRCGLACACLFTDSGARRSELPSRSTGFTADPLIRS